MTHDQAVEIIQRHSYDGGWTCLCGWTGAWSEWTRHLADSLLRGPGLEALREAAQEVLAAMGDRPPEGPEPTTAEVERWFVANDIRIIRALASLRAALAWEAYNQPTYAGGSF